MEPPQPESEPVFMYDLEDDPLKAEVLRILATSKAQKFRREMNPKTRMFEKPKEKAPTGDPYRDEEILSIKYPGGLGHPQAGHFSVGAVSLDKNGRDIGGGWVESFEDRLGAERCAYIIRRINPDHEPVVSPQEK